MSFKRVLIANRGEIAIRIARAAAEMGLNTVAVFAEDDDRSLHVKAADQAVALKGAGPKAYLDIEGVISAALTSGCDAVHPGYGFLSENASFAKACAAAGIAFIGPAPEVLEAFGDKARARELAGKCGLALIPGTGAISLKEAQAFLGKQGAIMIKAVSGGGGRGMRAVRKVEELEAAFAACEREAQTAFGSSALYAEKLLENARQIEVQVAGDGTRAVAVGERDCSLQRRHQKIVEIAPAPNLTDELRGKLHAAAVKLAESVRLRTVGTIEFLVEGQTFYFIEANPRLQVEHTVTEEVTGVDLVKAQIALRDGRSLTDLNLASTPPSQGFAVQARVNLESAGEITAYEPPSGPGIRVDGYGYAGYVASPAYDPLLAKVIGRGPTLIEALTRCGRALAETRIEGVATNIGMLRVLLGEPKVLSGAAGTRFAEDNADKLARKAQELTPRAFISEAEPPPPASEPVPEAPPEPEPEPAAEEPVDDGSEPVPAPLQSTVGSIEVKVGDTVRPGQTLAILEAMKMEHVVEAPTGGRVVRIAAEKGETLAKGAPILFLDPMEISISKAQAEEKVDLDAIRPDLQEVIERHRFTLDEARPEAVEKRRKLGMRTARENIEDLVDPGSFIEYGALTIAAQRRRRTLEDLIKSTPADGLIAGVGTVNGAMFGPEKARCAALAYDFTVLAGTQGHFNHKKTDRLLGVIDDQKLPVVWFAEGGGGRPGDTDALGVAGLDVTTFAKFAQLSGEVPKIAVVAGRCFAGNAAIAGLSEIIIATKGSNLGMGGPAMIEGGGLGVFAPEDIGPSETQYANGVIDVLADDEAHATRLAKQALSYFQGPMKDWSAPDQRHLRRAVPENRLRVYDIHALINVLVDESSFLELRGGFASGMVTGLVRIEGRPMGLIANDPRHLGGAIDGDAAEKAARFLQLCDAFDLPVVSLCDTPGFMVGPDSENAAAVRRVSRQFIAGAKLGTPLLVVVLRKGYGLGAQAMAGGGFHSPVFIASWPTGEFGGMGLEGAVRLGYRKELEAETDPEKQKALFADLVGKMYERGKAASMAAALEIDAVIDPVDTRRWILRGLDSCPPRKGPYRKRVDAW
ncbi:MAG TPA: carboxyl transferase domain-containing protein [Caulobacteraceae bacterium]|nr:carboxyl transferase domain-containing protein [Caulobacteraceae bacterium]